MSKKHFKIVKIVTTFSDESRSIRYIIKKRFWFFFWKPLTVYEPYDYSDYELGGMNMIREFKSEEEAHKFLDEKYNRLVKKPPVYQEYDVRELSY